jgi:hypothetical protein
MRSITQQLPLSVGIKPEPQAQNLKNPNTYSLKPDAPMVSVGIKNQNPILVRA